MILCKVMTYTNVSAPLTALLSTFLALSSSKWWKERLNILHSFFLLPSASGRYFTVLVASTGLSIYEM